MKDNSIPRFFSHNGRQVNLLESKSDELIYAEQLMYKAKFEKALEILKSFEREKTNTPKDELSTLILKGRIYNYKEQYKKAVEFGELAYDLSQRMGDITSTIDGLLIKSYIAFLGEQDKALDLILEAEKLLNSVSGETYLNHSRQQSDFLIIKSRIYRLNDDLNKALELALHWVETREKIAEKIDISLIYWLLGDIYLYKSEPNKALDYALKSLTIQKELESQIGIASNIALVGLCYYIKGDFDQALIYCKQSLTINEMSITAKTGSLHTLGAIYKEKGELDRTLRYYTRSLSLAENEDYIEGVIYNLMGIGSTYRMKGDFYRAIDYLKRSLTLSERLNLPHGIYSSLFYLVLTNLDKNSLEQAQIYLTQLEQVSQQMESKAPTQACKIAKALMLKIKGRIRNHSEAELLLKQIVESEPITPRLYLQAIVNLCDLFLDELSMTNNPEVLDEINPLINRMSTIAENQHVYLWLTETKLLQAKLALIQMDIVEAKQLLTHAQRIAELHGLNLLAIKISSEHDNLLEQVNDWDNLKKINAPMSERIKLASFDGVIDRMQGKQAVEIPKLTPEVPVLLLIIGEGGFPLFSNQFAEKWAFEDDLISGFLSAFNSFSGELFSKGLDRAKFGEYTILMQSVEMFSICYLFKGQTYLARRKLIAFKEGIQNTTSIWETLNKFYKSSRNVELKDIPSLKSLVVEIFIKKSLDLDIFSNQID